MMSERRRAPRFTASGMAVATVGSQTRSFELRDVSAVGAMLAGAWLPVPGERVSLVLEMAGRRLVLHAVGVWERADGTAGVAFAPSVSPHEQTVLLVGEPGADDLLLTEDLVRRGITALHCRTAVEAVRRLVHAEAQIRSVVVSAHMGEHFRHEFTRFVAEEFPSVRVLSPVEVALAS